MKSSWPQMKRKSITRRARPMAQIQLSSSAGIRGRRLSLPIGRLQDVVRRQGRRSARAPATTLECFDRADSAASPFAAAAAEQTFAVRRPPPGLAELRLQQLICWPRSRLIIVTRIASCEISTTRLFFLSSSIALAECGPPVSRPSAARVESRNREVARHKLYTNEVVS
jgi:hypothetical protein